MVVAFAVVVDKNVIAAESKMQACELTAIEAIARRLRTPLPEAKQTTQFSFKRTNQNERMKRTSERKRRSSAHFLKFLIRSFITSRTGRSNCTAKSNSEV